MKNKQISVGAILITLVAIWSAFGSYIFDWNKTHIYNPHWPPHAKFHNAQTMLLGTALGLFSLWTLWAKKGDRLGNIKIASVLASFYWLTQMGAILFPGTALEDPEFHYPGEPPHQLIVDIVMLIMLSAGYWLALRSWNKASGLAVN